MDSTLNQTDEVLRASFGSLGSRNDLADLLGVKLNFLTYVLYRDGIDNYYRTWEISKKSGGTRKITAPQSHLYFLQARLNQILQAVYVPKASTHGFVRDRSVVSNAAKHVQKQYVLNLDLQEFFPTINFGRVRGLFLSRPFHLPKEVATLLATLCCYENGLPIGAPTSPVIANMICMRLDVELQRLARRTGCWFTRYADDLTFSSNRPFPLSIIQYQQDGTSIVGDELSRIIKSNGFVINAKKFRLQAKDRRQEVTGVIVNEKLNVDRRFIRQIRAMLHNWEFDGLEQSQDNFLIKDRKDRYPDANPRFVKVLDGKISYLGMVRGSDDQLVVSLRAQFMNLRSGQPRKAGLERAMLLHGRKSQKRSIRILHLSDLHFREKSHWDSHSILNRLVTCLEREAANPDLVLITGDIANSGEKDEYGYALDWFQNSLLGQLGIERDRVFCVPGNHDVSRFRVSETQDAFHRQIIAEAGTQAKLASLLIDDSDRTILLRKFDNYCWFVKEMTGDDLRANPYWHKEVEISKDFQIALASIHRKTPVSFPSGEFAHRFVSPTRFRALSVNLGVVV